MPFLLVLLLLLFPSSISYSPTSPPPPFLPYSEGFTSHPNEPSIYRRERVNPGSGGSQAKPNIFGQNEVLRLCHNAVGPDDSGKVRKTKGKEGYY